MLNFMWPTWPLEYLFIEISVYNTTWEFSFNKDKVQVKNTILVCVLFVPRLNSIIWASGDLDTASDFGF